MNEEQLLTELMDEVAGEYDQEREVNGWWISQKGNFTYVTNADYEVSDLREWPTEEEAIFYLDNFTPPAEEDE